MLFIFLSLRRCCGFEPVEMALLPSPADLTTRARALQAVGTRTPLPADWREDTIIVWQQEAKQEPGEGVVMVVVQRRGLHLSTCLRRLTYPPCPSGSECCLPDPGPQMLSQSPPRDQVCFPGLL